MPSLTKPVRSTLESIWQGFKRCSYRHPSIYHELWEAQLPLEEALPELFKPVSIDVAGKSLIVYDVPDIGSINDAFRKANDYSSCHPWEWWHEPTGRGRYFGCFHGEDGAGFQDFRRLADSAYLVLHHVDPQLPQDASFHGWMKTLHEMAICQPTPLLRSTSMVWQSWECESDEDHERWIKPEKGAPYPQHPVQRKLEHDVFTSSMAAIDLILDDEQALVIGRQASRFPISFPGGEIHECQETEVIDREESTSAHERVVRFEQGGKEWHFEFITDSGPMRATRPAKFRGYRVLQYLLSEPDKWIGIEDIFRETGQAEKLDGALTRSDQKQIDPEAGINYCREIERLQMELDDTVNLERQSEIQLEIEAIKKVSSAVDSRGRPRSFTTDTRKYADQIQRQLSGALGDLRREAEELADFLEERLERNNYEFKLRLP